MKIQYLAKSLLQDYKISYMNEIQYTLRIFPTFSKFTLLTSTLFYILFNSIHDNCNTYLPKTKKFCCVGMGDLTSLFFSKVAK